MRKISLNEKGQAFASMRLLIGAVMGLLILVIIISAISYFENLEIDISVKRVNDGFANAVKQPDGSILEVGDAVLLGQTFSSSGISKKMGIESDCVELYSRGSPAFEEITAEKAIEVRQRVKTSVYVRCETDPPFGSDCPIGCTVSFGKPI
ncbi:MAG: hypothetical protein V1494_02280 [Candidatus Diapherotrites archaeon]